MFFRTLIIRETQEYKSSLDIKQFTRRILWRRALLVVECGLIRLYVLGIERYFQSSFRQLPPSPPAPHALYPFLIIPTSTRDEKWEERLKDELSGRALTSADHFWTDWFVDVCRFSLTYITASRCFEQCFNFFLISHFPPVFRICLPLISYSFPRASIADFPVPTLVTPVSASSATSFPSPFPYYVSASVAAQLFVLLEGEPTSVPQRSSLPICLRPLWCRQ